MSTTKPRPARARTDHLSGVNRRRWLTAALTVWVAFGCAGRADPETSRPITVVYPGATWEAVPSPESAGWSSEGLDRVREKLSGMSTTGMVAIVGGRVLLEYGDVQAISYLASVRKSVLSMLYGIYVDRGAIDLDDTLEELGIDDIGGLTREEKQATVRDLLRARSGVYHEASNGGDDLASAPRRGSQRPGAYYLYSNWDFNALGAIFEQETGKDVYDALGEELAVPLGFQDWDRSIQRKSGDTTKSLHRAYHMNLSTRDMARIGYLMLRNGRWQGRQIVPEAWVEESTRAHTRVHKMNPQRHRDGPFGYGYLWWVFDRPALGPEYEGAYTGLGAVGQHILVMPALDLVVAHKTRPGEGRRVSHAEFLEVVERLVAARCDGVCGNEVEEREAVRDDASATSSHGAMALPRSVSDLELGGAPRASRIPMLSEVAARSAAATAQIPPSIPRARSAELRPAA